MSTDATRRRIAALTTIDAGMSETLMEAVAALDAVATVQAYVAILQEAAAVADSVQDVLITPSESLSESVLGIITAIDQKLYPPETLSEVAVLVDTLQELYGLIETVTEQAQVIDTVADAQAYVQQLADVATGAPTIEVLQRYLHTLNEIAVAVDSGSDSLVGLLNYLPKARAYLVPPIRPFVVPA